MKDFFKLLMQQWKLTAALIVFLVLAIAVYRVLHRKELPVLPQSILHLALTEEINGETARQMIYGMHGSSIFPADNLIGTYVSPDGKGVLSISLYPSTNEANAAYDTLKHSIGNAPPTFTHFRIINSGGQYYAMCYGHGQTHYFFVHQDKLYWWSVDMTVAQASFRDLLKRVQTQP
jgi:hypothetical protein